MESGLHVVVRNTFLEFSDDTPSLECQEPLEPRRVRAFSDMTDSKLPIKVELSNNSNFYQVSRHRISSTLEGTNANAKAGGDAPSSGAPPPKTGEKGSLPTVLEEPDLPSGFGTGLSGMMPGEYGAGMPPLSPLPGGPPGELGGGMPWMPPFGAGAPYPPNPMWWGGYGALSGQGLAPPPFPPGMMNYPGYSGQPSPPGNFGGPQSGQGQHHVPQAEAAGRAPETGRGRAAGGRSHTAAGAFAGAAPRLQLSEHLGDAGGKQKKAQHSQVGSSQTAAQAAAAQAAASLAAAPAAHLAQSPVEDEQLPVNSGELTTVMLRNVPNGYKRDMLLELLDSHGFRGLYDFVYLPMDFRNGVNLGYAFVNLLTNKDAFAFTEEFQGFASWAQSDSTKVCEVSWSHPHQGLREHVERYRNSPVMHATMPDEFKPMVFRSGVQVVFPAPTKAIKAPKLRLTAREGRHQGQEAGARLDQPGMPDFVAVCA